MLIGTIESIEAIGTIESIESIEALETIESIEGLGTIESIEGLGADGEVGIGAEVGVGKIGRDDVELDRQCLEGAWDLKPERLLAMLEPAGVEHRDVQCPG